MRRSVTAPCSSSRSSPAAGTSRCRSSATRTATSSTSASASARSSAATRRSSRSRRRRASRERRGSPARRRASRLARHVGYVGRRHGRVHGRRTRSGHGRSGHHVPRGQHTPAGRAPGDRGGDRARPRRTPAARRRRRAAAVHPGRRSRSAGMRSRCGWSPKTQPRLVAVGRARHRVRIGSPRRRARRRRLRAGSVVSADYDSMLAKVICHARRPSGVPPLDSPSRCDRTASPASAPNDLADRDHRRARLPRRQHADPLSRRAPDVDRGGRCRRRRPIVASARRRVRRSSSATGRADTRHRIRSVRVAQPADARPATVAGIVDGDSRPRRVRDRRRSGTRAGRRRWPAPGENGVLAPDTRSVHACGCSVVARRARCSRSTESRRDGRRRVASATRSSPGRRRQCRSGTVAVPRFDDHDADRRRRRPVCPLPGTVIAVHVAAGDARRRGQLLMVVEAMKMEHQITAAGRRRRRSSPVRCRRPRRPGRSARRARSTGGVARGGMAEPIRIANCSGFFGDRLSARAGDGRRRPDRRAHRRLAGRADDADPGPDPGQAAGPRVRRHVRHQMEQVMGTCLDRGIKVVSNAGGLDPAGCAEAVQRGRRPARAGARPSPTSMATICIGASRRPRRARSAAARSTTATGDAGSATSRDS